MNTAKQLNTVIGWNETADILDTIHEMHDGSEDFEVSNFRFIHSDHIDRIQCEELENDEYILGCFNAWLIADVLGIDTGVIEAMQKAEAFEAIGKLIISQDKLEALQQEYVSADGYGHHFNHQDGNEYEVEYNGQTWYAFQM